MTPSKKIFSISCQHGTFSGATHFSRRSIVICFMLVTLVEFLSGFIIVFTIFRFTSTSKMCWVSSSTTYRFPSLGSIARLRPVELKGRFVNMRLQLTTSESTVRPDEGFSVCNYHQKLQIYQCKVLSHIPSAHLLLLKMWMLNSDPRLPLHAKLVDDKSSPGMKWGSACFWELGWTRYKR